MNADGPQKVTVQAAYQGKTASCSFTVTDHFSPRRDHASAVLNGDLYLIGGRTAATERSNEVWRSADDGLTWDQVAEGTATDNTLFTPRSAHTAEVIGDAIYLLGGSTTDGTNRNRFDDVWTSADRGVTWRQTAATPRYPAREAHSSAVLGTTLYVIMGSASYGAAEDIWRSTNLGSTWSQVANNIVGLDPHFSHTSVVLGNRVYVIGGFEGLGSVDSVRRSAATVGNTGWSQVATGTRFSARREHSAVVLDGTIYVIGGLPRNDEVWRSADQGVTWRQMAAGARFSARDEHTSAALSGALYVIGGFEKTTDPADPGTRLNDVWKSTNQGVTWTNVHANP